MRPEQMEHRENFALELSPSFHHHVHAWCDQIDIPIPMTQKVRPQRSMDIKTKRPVSLCLR